MATFVQILIAAILSIFGMHPNDQEKADKEETVRETSFQTHNFLFPAEKNENQKWEFLLTERTNCDSES